MTTCEVPSFHIRQKVATLHRGPVTEVGLHPTDKKRTSTLEPGTVSQRTSDSQDSTQPFTVAENVTIWLVRPKRGVNAPPPPNCTLEIFLHTDLNCTAFDL